MCFKSPECLVCKEAGRRANYRIGGKAYYASKESGLVIGGGPTPLASMKEK